MSKAGAIIQAHEGISWRGLKSRVLDDLCGKPVLLRTLERLQMINGVDQIIVITSDNTVDDQIMENVTDWGFVCERFPIPQETMIRSPRYNPAFYGYNYRRENMEDGILTWQIDAAEKHELSHVLITSPGSALLDFEKSSELLKEHLEQDADITIVQHQFNYIRGSIPEIFKTEALKKARNNNQDYAIRGELSRYMFESQAGYSVNSCELPSVRNRRDWYLIADSRRNLETLRSAYASAGANGEPVNRDKVLKWFEEDDLRRNPFPQRMEIETTTRCQLACKMCPRTSFHFQEWDMEPELFNKIMNDFARYDDQVVIFSGMGEPLLNPYTTEYIKYAKKAGIHKTILYTNGIELDKRKSEELCNSGLDIIVFNLQATNKEKYQEIHNKDFFGEVSKNIDEFMIVRHSLGKTNILVLINLIRPYLEVEEIEEFYSIWGTGTTERPHVDNFQICGYSSYGGRMTEFPERDFTMNRFPCRQLAGDLYIMVDGRVTPCRQDFEGHYVLGNVRATSLESIWTGPRAAKIRELHNTGRWDEIKTCSNCKQWIYH